MYNKNTRKYNGNKQYANKPKQTRNYHNDSQEFPASNSERKLKTISFNDFIPAQKQVETKPAEQMQTEIIQTEQNETKYFNVIAIISFISAIGVSIIHALDFFLSTFLKITLGV